MPTGPNSSPYPWWGHRAGGPAADARVGARVLVLKKHWLQLILSGERTVEIRGQNARQGHTWLAAGTTIYLLREAHLARRISANVRRPPAPMSILAVQEDVPRDSTCATSTTAVSQGVGSDRLVQGSIQRRTSRNHKIPYVERVQKRPEEVQRVQRGPGRGEQVGKTTLCKRDPKQGQKKTKPLPVTAHPSPKPYTLCPKAEITEPKQ